MVIKAECHFSDEVGESAFAAPPVSGQVDFCLTPELLQK
jgi:hypothetical protein